MRTCMMVLTLMLLAGSCLALPTPPATIISIDAYAAPADLAGFWLYIQDGQACDPQQWSDSRRVDLGLPTRSADGLRDEWDVSNVTELKATDCIQLTAYDAVGNESDFASIAEPGDNVGWFGLDRGRNVQVR